MQRDEWDREQLRERQARFLNNTKGFEERQTALMNEKPQDKRVTDGSRRKAD
jgi:hypothetical protein